MTQGAGGLLELSVPVGSRRKYPKPVQKVPAQPSHRGVWRPDGCCSSAVLTLVWSSTRFCVHWVVQISRL